jgi:hypothetical protein
MASYLIAGRRFQAENLEELNFLLSEFNLISHLGSDLTGHFSVRHLTEPFGTIRYRIVPSSKDSVKEDDTWQKQLELKLKKLESELKSILNTDFTSYSRRAFISEEADNTTQYQFDVIVGKPISTKYNDEKRFSDVQLSDLEVALREVRKDMPDSTLFVGTY